MDLTSLSFLFVILVGYLGVDAAIHPPDAILDGEASTSFKDTTINSTLVSDVLNGEAARISSTATIMTRPVIRVGRLQGVAMSIAETFKMEQVAYALQAQLGHQPDQIKVSLFGEGGIAKVLITGTSHRRMAPFQEELAQQPGETIVSLLQRAAVKGMAHIDPYVTALNEVQNHAAEKDFSEAEAIIHDAMDRLPPTPESFDRSLFENLNGLIALFRDNVQEARDWFARAEASCPDFTTADAVSAVNAAFSDVQTGNYKSAAARMDRLLNEKPPTDPVMLSTAHMTLAAADMGLGQRAAAEQELAKATTIYPTGSSAYDLWSDIKRAEGNFAAADEMHQKALEMSASFENYAEVATLYFRLAWNDNKAVMRSPYSNPEKVPARASSRGQ